MAPIDDKAMQWLARSLAWDRTLAHLRSDALEATVAEATVAEPAVPPVGATRPRTEPISLREPERATFGAPRDRVPRRDHRVRVVTE
jgi:hypothetical protein